MLGKFRKVKKQKKKRLIQKLIRAGSLPRKQNKNFPQNNKKFLKSVAASGFGKFTK